MAQANASLGVKTEELEGAHATISDLRAEISRLQKLLADKNVKFENEVKQLEQKAAQLAQEKYVVIPFSY